MKISDLEALDLPSFKSAALAPAPRRRPGSLLRVTSISLLPATTMPPSSAPCIPRATRSTSTATSFPQTPTPTPSSSLTERTPQTTPSAVSFLTTLPEPTTPAFIKVGPAPGCSMESTLTPGKPGSTREPSRLRPTEKLRRSSPTPPKFVSSLLRTISSGLTTPSTISRTVEAAEP